MCDRCKKETTITTGSYFNTQMICLDCEKEEEASSRYKEARGRENEEVRRGNYNFEGIGWKGN